MPFDHPKKYLSGFPEINPQLTIIDSHRVLAEQVIAQQPKKRLFYRGHSTEGRTLFGSKADKDQHKEDSHYP